MNGIWLRILNQYIIKQANRQAVRIIGCFQMSFKATVDMFVNFSYIQVRFLNRQGFLRYRMKIYMKYEGNQTPCHPYNVAKGAVSMQDSFIMDSDLKLDSLIDSDTLYYYSRLIPVVYRPGNYQQNQTVFFKAYINTEIIQDIQFYCVIECLFTEKPNEKLQVVGKFEARIRKINDISTFLPVVFDVFEGFMIFSTFHSTILEFRFSEDDFETIGNKKTRQMAKQCHDFYSYAQLVTNKFGRKQLYEFYLYYRDFLEKQYGLIQNRHEQLIKKLVGQLKTKAEQKELEASNNSKAVKITKNSQLVKFIKGSVYQVGFTSEPLTMDEQEIATEAIAKDFTIMKGHLYRKWMQFANFVIHYSKLIAKCYRKQYQSLCKDRFKNNVFSHKIKNHDWKVAKYTDSGKTNLEQAFSVKKKINSEQELWKEHFPIENINFFGKSETNVKMFQEVYLTNSPITKLQAKQKLRHIIVLVHGFQASRQDFILLKNCLQVTYGVHAIISTCNEGLTQSSIVQAGQRLASEVKKILSTQSGEYRLSFIGHSMGGLIIRSAIPDMSTLADKFYMYMSFSSPHLGYLYQSSALVKAGLWILSSWNKIQAVQELSMKDKVDLRETVLYKLSKNNSLLNFKKLCFVCSSLDQYVAYQSARVEQNEKLMTETLDKNTQNVIREMVEGMIGQVRSPEISRINVVFNIQGKQIWVNSRNLDSFLGRAGHVKFLSDIQFIREFCACFDQFFA